MTNNKEIKKLKYQKTKKKEAIKRYKKRIKKHIFFLVVPFIIYIFLYIDSAYKEFGSVTKFLTIILSILGTLTVFYLLLIRYLIRQKEQDIKMIRSKLYQLMKLDDD